MSGALNIYKDRTNIVPVNLWFDVSLDTLTCQIREGKTKTTELIVTGVVSFLTDGEDGKLLVTFDNSDVADVTQTRGYMDIKRVSGGEPFAVFTDPLRVRFKDTVTE